MLVETMNNIISKVLLVSALSFIGTSCSNDFLDRKPLDQIGPDQYFKTDAQLQSFTMKQYDNAFISYNQSYSAGMATLDNGTDNQAQRNSPNRQMFSLDNWKVSASEGLGFSNIRDINLFLKTVEGRLNSISGPKEEINQALGEAYFFRAYQYFGKLQNYGDYPIVKEALPNKEEILVEQAKRQPRNEVARFILSDLDKAIELLKESTPRKQRISKNAARLFRSRVALFEGTFEKYHAGSGRVPGDATWPGKDKEWNKGKTFNQEAEIKYFLTEAMKDAKLVADATELTPNTEVTNPTNSIHGWNPYFEMFGIQNPSVYSEVLLWREYNRAASVVHHTSNRMTTGTGTGWTRGLVESFLTKDGKPYYAVASTRSDATIKDVKKDRDGRLQLFMFAEGDVSEFRPNKITTFEQALFLDASEVKESTGYRQRKGKNYDPDNLNGGVNDDSGYIIFRASEAYLNYIEASYLLSGNLTAEARGYWEKLRVRAGIKAGRIDETIAATDMSKEADVNRASYDWAAFSGGKAIDKTLYSIRRERRCEFAGEGMRMFDLKRWRAMDQVKDYQLEGVNFWDKIHEYEYFIDKNTKKSKLKDDESADANISARSKSKYVRPYQIVKPNNDMYNGYTFYQAHYLSPFSVEEMQLCSPTRDEKNSNLYQNPGWPTTANQHALEK